MRGIIVAVAVAVLGATTAACGLGAAQAEPRRAWAGDTAQITSQPEEGVTRSEGRRAEPVYVINLYGAEDGRADQRPENLVVSEFSTLKGITWRSWGPGRAVGAGKLSGTWCLPDCLDSPYDATITLSKVKKAMGKRYFTKFAIDGDFPKPDQIDDTLTGALPLPAS
ncbi:hypothetical protein [Streptosporangium carneum]|nr:hypothetical protein [Streptosporangium carneum]